MRPAYRRQEPAALLLLTALAGCAAPRPTREALDQGQGVVILSLTSNTARTGQFDTIRIGTMSSGNASAPSHDPLTAEGPKPEPGHELRYVTRDLSSSTALYLGTVPPGTYHVRRLLSGSRYVQLQERTSEALGAIRVQPGKVHDLGRLVLTGHNQQVVLGRSAAATSNAELVRRFTPEYAAFVSGPVEAGWVGPRGPDDRVEEYALANPVGVRGLVAIDGGDVAAASRMGTVLLRSADGRWRAARLGSPEALHWVAPLAGGDDRLVAVGELSTIAVLGRDGKLRRLSPGNLPAGNLLFVAGDAASGWVVAHRDGSAVTLFHSERLDGGTWKPLRREERTVLQDGPFWFWRTEAGFGYANGTVSTYWWDRATRRLVERKVPSERGITVVAPCGPRGVCVRLADFLPSVYATSDEGRTFRELSPPDKLRPPTQLPGGRFLHRQFIVDKLWVSDDGQSWEEAGSVRTGENVVAVPGVGLFAIDEGEIAGITSIRFSADQGRSWKLELSNYDRTAAPRK